MTTRRGASVHVVGEDKLAGARFHPRLGQARHGRGDRAVRAKRDASPEARAAREGASGCAASMGKLGDRGAMGPFGVGSEGLRAGRLVEGLSGP